ncbi:hypothetical protein BDY24DRAFT_391733 [Mrakia frigida]|uniref:uncharacterized protein n=1 Tax=Mrakia frigida TaxID=29902 RepID=UPI003FCC1393
MGDEGEEKRRRREASSVSLSAAAASSTALQNLSGTNSRTSSSNLPSSSLFLQPQDSTIATSVARSLVHHTLRNPSSPSPIHPQLNPAYPVAAQPPHPPTGTYGDYGLEGVDEAQLSPFAIGLKRRREREIFVLRWDAGTGWTG